MISILTTLDGSEEALAVLPIVQKLAQGQEARVELLMVVHRPSATARQSTIVRAPTGPAGGVPGAPDSVTRPSTRRAEPQWAESESQAIERVMDEAKEYLESAAAPLRDSGLKVTTEVEVADDVAGAIVSYAQAHPSDLIAMATHGRSGISALVQGSVTAAVTRSGVAPVLQVRPKK